MWPLESRITATYQWFPYVRTNGLSYNRDLLVVGYFAELIEQSTSSSMPLRARY